MKDSLFETYTLSSQSPNNAVNLEVPLPSLLRALRSASPSSLTLSNATSYTASIRLTKKDDTPSLCVTLVIKTPIRSALPSAGSEVAGEDSAGLPVHQRERETHVSQDVPIRVLSAEKVSSLHEPHVREPDVHILLPSLAQLKSISDRFTKLATAGVGSASTGTRGGSRKSPRLELSANMFGRLKLGLKTDEMEIASEWKDLTNPDLDASAYGGEEALREHPSTRMRQQGEESWATVRVDARDWGRVLSVGRVAGRVIACFIHEHALILYVYLMSEEGSDESVLTVRFLLRHDHSRRVRHSWC